MPHKINVYGVIGSEFSGGITAKSVVSQLATIAESDDPNVDLHINSGGGYVDDAVAMFNRLRKHAKDTGGQINVYIDGLAASAATLVALAGDTVTISANATMMVHQPWGLALGTAEDMRKSADLLDMTEQTMIAMYVASTGLDAGEVRHLLAAETWMAADEALSLGFVDVVEDAADVEDAAALAQFAAVQYIAAAATVDKLASYQNAPEWARSVAAAQPNHRQASTRPAASADNAPETAPTNDAATAAMTEQHQMATENKPSTPPIAEPAANASAQTPANAADIVRAERERARAIRAAASRFELDQAFVDGLVDNGATVAEANAQILARLAEQPVANVSTITRGADEADKRIVALERGIMARAGMLSREEAAAERSNPYRGKRLAAMAIEFAGERGHGSEFEQVGRALASANRTGDYYGAHGRPSADIGITHTISDFTSVLANVAHKSMLLGWDQTPQTHEPWTNRGVLTDFRPATRAGLNLAPALLEVEEGAEYKGASIDDRGVTVELATYGRTFGITRQALINDDLMAFTDLPRRMGQAAARTVGNAVYGILTTNGNLADGNPLFDAAHSNTSAIDYDADGLATLKTAMRTQTDPDGTTVLGIVPAYLVVPAALEYTCQVLLNAGFISDGTTTVGNVLAGSLGLIVEPRLDATSGSTGYLMADGNLYDTIEVAYLDGVDVPMIEQMDGWRADGTEFKVRIDFGVAVRDHRAMVRGT